MKQQLLEKTRAQSQFRLCSRLYKIKITPNALAHLSQDDILLEPGDTAGDWGTSIGNSEANERALIEGMALVTVSAANGIEIYHRTDNTEAPSTYSSSEDYIEQSDPWFRLTRAALAILPTLLTNRVIHGFTGGSSSQKCTEFTGVSAMKNQRMTQTTDRITALLE